MLRHDEIEHSKRVANAYERGFADALAEVESDYTRRGLSKTGPFNWSSVQRAVAFVRGDRVR